MIGVVGAGAFGTALAVTLAREGRAVTLWARSAEDAAAMTRTRINARRLPGVDLPEGVRITADLADLAGARAVLLALPMQALGGFLAASPPRAPDLVACCKGIDLGTLSGPTALIRRHVPGARASILTGPSFAADLARGLPTALTLAGGDEALQRLLSGPSLRLYRTDDVIGAELGGALKNVIAIAAGVVIGAGLGESARAALMTRGYAEMTRLARSLGARPETLAGLSGFGDLVLTCTSAQSRNFSYGRALGAGQDFDPTVTVEGAATARAVARLARNRAVEMPLTTMIAALIDGQTNLSQAITALMSRPLKEE
ncbi:MAG: NAD(P)H-dependent glycerol-3-phosphate dehydrogenase [Paracoccaceae bacterium]